MRIFRVASLVVAMAFTRSSHAASCADTITENTTLTADVVGCGQFGLAIGADNIVLDCDGHSIVAETQHSAPWAGISLTGRSGVTITNCRVLGGFRIGIDASGSSANTLSNNTVTGAIDAGISLASSSNSNTLVANTVSGTAAGTTGAAYGIGIWLRFSHSNELSNNSVSGNRNGNLKLEASGGNTIEDNTLADSIAGWGLDAEFSDANTIHGNTLSGNRTTGVTLYAGDSNVLDDNTITGNGTGVVLYNASRTSLVHDAITGNTGIGVQLAGASGTVVNHDSIHGNGSAEIASSDSQGSDLTLDYFGGVLTCADKVRFAGVFLAELAPYYVDETMTDPPTGTAPENCPLICGDRVGGNAGDVVTLTQDIGNCAAGLEIAADDITLDCGGHSITGSATSFAGISLSGRTGVTIKNCTVSQFSLGISAAFSSFNTVSGNTLTGNRSTGVTLTGSSNANALLDNSITGNGGNGVVLQFSNGNVLAGNTVTGNLGGGVKLNTANDTVVNRNRLLANQGYDLFNSGSAGADLTHNYFGGQLTCADKPRFKDIALAELVPYYLDEAMTDPATGAAPAGCPLICGEKVAGNPGDVITLTQDIVACDGDGLELRAGDIVLDCDGHTISGTGQGTGITSYGWSGVTIKNCTVSGFAAGVFLGAATSSTVSGNQVRGCQSGISVSGGSNDAIVNNTVTDNQFIGMMISGATASTFAGNTVSGSNYGIRLFFAKANTLSDNDVSGNRIAGLSVEFADSNTLSGNRMTGNYVGISFNRSSSNTVESNQSCNSTSFDMYTASSTNSGTDNACDLHDGWSDTGVSGCTHACDADQDGFLYFDDRCPESYGTFQGCRPCPVEVEVTSSSTATPKQTPVVGASVEAFDWTDPTSCAAQTRPSDSELACDATTSCTTGSDGKCGMVLFCDHDFDVVLASPPTQGAQPRRSLEDVSDSGTLPIELRISFRGAQ